MDSLSLGIKKGVYMLKLWNWIKARIIEWSSVDGALIVAVSLLVLLGQLDLLALLAWPALAFGIYRIVVAEK